MGMIEISKEIHDEMIIKIKNYMNAELDLEIEGFDVEFLLNFFTSNIRIYYYNQALEDVHTLISKKMDHIADSIYDLEKPIPNSN